MAIKIVSFESLQTLAPVQDQIVDIYRQAFATAPYYKKEPEVISFTKVLARHAEREGFRCVAARDEGNGQLLGFGYGYTGAEGQWWHELVVQAMEPENAQRWMTDVFEVVELAVRPSAQGRGLGGQIHDTLLRGLPHRTAALSTYQTETTALKMYRQRGWVTLLHNFMFPGIAEPYQIMGRMLREKGANGQQSQ